MSEKPSQPTEPLGRRKFLQVAGAGGVGTLVAAALGGKVGADEQKKEEKAPEKLPEGFEASKPAFTKLEQMFNVPDNLPDADRTKFNERYLPSVTEVKPRVVRTRNRGEFKTVKQFPSGATVEGEFTYVEGDDKEDNQDHPTVTFRTSGKRQENRPFEPEDAVMVRFMPTANVAESRVSIERWVTEMVNGERQTTGKRIASAPIVGGLERGKRYKYKIVESDDGIVVYLVDLTKPLVQGGKEDPNFPTERKEGENFVTFSGREPGSGISKGTDWAGTTVEATKK